MSKFSNGNIQIYHARKIGKVQLVMDCLGGAERRL